jgi:hypothetical protein
MKARRVHCDSARGADVVSPRFHHDALGGFHALSSHATAAAVAALSAAPPVAAQITLNVITAGDQNMVEYVTNYLGPKFETMNPGVKVRATGTGPGDSGSQKIYELSAQQAGSASWDTDVAVVHQRGAATMVNEKLLMPYRNDVAAGKLVSRDTAKNALGANVDGYVLPMFHSQIAFAYNPISSRRRRSPTRSSRVGEEEPETVRLQRRQGRHVGRGLRDGLGVRQFGLGDKLEKGPYAAGDKATIEVARGLKDFNQNVVMTPGNAGTLDMLNRGEISMGPVWVDMFYTWQADGKVSPKIALVAAAGLPRQPMCYVIRRKRDAALAKKFIDLAESPVQADSIVKQFNWYPGSTRSTYSEAHAGRVEQALHRYFAGRPRAVRQAVPAVQYFTDIVEGYERVVLK